MAPGAPRIRSGRGGREGGGRGEPAPVGEGNPFAAEPSSGNPQPPGAPDGALGLPASGKVLATPGSPVLWEGRAKIPPSSPAASSLSPGRPAASGRTNQGSLLRTSCQARLPREESRLFQSEFQSQKDAEGPSQAGEIQTPPFRRAQDVLLRQSQDSNSAPARKLEVLCLLWKGFPEDWRLNLEETLFH